MMKRLLTFILASCYLCATIGATITTHYCMGKLYAVDLSHHTNCGKCGMKTDKSCCKDESRTFKIQDDHQPSGNQQQIVPLFAFSGFNRVFPAPAFPKDINIPSTHNNSPPGFRANLIGIFNSVFRI